MPIPQEFTQAADWELLNIVTFEFRGEQITWNRYESLIWALGESFRQVLSKNKPLRKSGRFFEAVQAICFEQKFGKGCESFTMLLGQYGGTSQIPALIHLLDDPQVYGHAIYSLRLLGAAEAADKVRPFLDEPKTWVKQEAHKFFKKIESTKKK
jgi:HEAT repeat protein